MTRYIIRRLLIMIPLLLGLSIFVWRGELGDASLLWWHSGVLMGAVQLVLGFLIQGLWVLPILGYLLLVSVSVPRMALLWAIALPVIPKLKITDRGLVDVDRFEIVPLFCAA